MKNNIIEPTNTTQSYKHSIVFWPFWSSVTVNLVLTVFRSSSVSSSLSYWLVNTPIMLVIGAVTVAYYRRRNVSPKSEALIGFFAPIIGLAIVGCLLITFLP